ncbi:MAG: carboxymuconolactone decarboxylase family protein [Acidobacteria bacterium]|uniref:Carboxymuconolactone decarboxylase family protein n=1 Tax=Candidatus Polarisedimenticola svalbardensis TaxID=2886004 RepID=A0A8J6Y900_9BACT|nr:carboxymuconolactone decarboxylase family protein [Candidatus Polarisedimenticola svalbardensis]
MKGFRIHTEETAGEPANRILKDVRKNLGFVPNLFAVFAESTPALQANVAMKGQLARTSLTPMERELVQIVTSVENRCGYCVAGHSTFAAMQNLPAEPIAAVRAGRPVSDDRLEALRCFTEALVRRRGHLDDDQVQKFYAAGYGPEQLLEVILAVCVKMFANLTNNVIGIPLDEQFSSYAWEPASDVTDSGNSRAA